jgi:hypothetical protein
VLLSAAAAQAQDLSVFEGDYCTSITVYGQSPGNRGRRHWLRPEDFTVLKLQGDNL